MSAMFVREIWSKRLPSIARAALASIGLALMIALLAAATPSLAQQPGTNVRPPASAGGPPPGTPAPGLPGADRGNIYDVEMWRKVRGGVEGHCTLPDRNACRLVQADGEAWRNLRNGPLPTYGAWGLAGVVGLLALFFLVRGRIKIDHGWSGRTIQRFTNFERMAHWLLAVSFIILALTGLNITYGRYVLLPYIGKEAFANVSIIGKWLHNYVAFAFMVALVLVFVRWVIHNFPSWRDIVWIAKGGGMLVKGSHPPAWKFNAGQKLLFWLVILGGVSLSLSGIALLFPFQTNMFAKTFEFLNKFGFNLPTTLTPIQEMQYATTWHAIMALVLTIVIIGHIYIGTIGMQGAFAAMGSGQVDVNWAKEHHSLWADQVLKGKSGDSPPPPAPVAPTGPKPVPAE